MDKSTVTTLMLFIFASLLFLGGVGVEVEIIQYFGVLVGATFVLAAYLLKKDIEFPSGFSLYGIFLVLFAASILWSSAKLVTFRHFTLFLSGGLIWLAFYNLDIEEGWISAEKLILGLGIFFGILFIYYQFFNDVEVRWRSLFLPYISTGKHNNIGDLWGILMIVLSHKLTKFPKKVFYWLLAFLGIYFLLASRSRSAVIALIAGVGYLFKDRLDKERDKKLFLAFLALSVVVFLVMGVSKTILFSRPYYTQAVYGLIENPFGIGVGSFSKISMEITNNPGYYLFALPGFSTSVHNIILEIMVGMGILGFSFVVWFVKRIVEVWKIKEEKIVYGASFIALAANFFFHLTYFIPTMLWLWFFFLALSQKARN